LHSLGGKISQVEWTTEQSDLHHGIRRRRGESEGGRKGVEEAVPLRLEDTRDMGP
jgi:hypothetical protein